MADQNDPHDPQHPPTESPLEIPALIPEDDGPGLKDVKQLGLIAAIASLSYVFWIVGAMEMVERLAYYGVKAVATLYAKDPVSAGGLGINLTQFGTILMVWALIQSLLPVFTGGLSDRYGYKETIFCSTVLKIMGYLLMAWFPTYWGFFAGAIVLASGTAVFKPGIQGTLVKATSRENSSMAWGIFYQTVNIGGFLGPLVAGLMRKMEWTYVFYACAAIICLNFLLLLTYREVGKDERLERKRLVKEGKLQRTSLVRESLRELAKPHVWTYLALFSGFWFMFNALFDVLPAHIDDWVDSSDIIKTLFPSGESTNKIVNFLVVMNPEGTAIQPEGMLNINAGMIMLVCFVFAWISGLMRATTSMVVGTLLASLALFMCGYATTGWMMIFAIVVFSAGEMLSSPKFSEFIGNFAPSDKKAMYLGFSQIPLAVGWTLEGKFGPMLYDIYASKDRFSRELLEQKLADGVGSLPEPADIAQIVAGANYMPEDATVALSMSDIMALEGDAFGDAVGGLTDKLVEDGMSRAEAGEIGRLLDYAEQNNVSLDQIATYMQSEQAEFIQQIPQGEAFDWLVTITGESRKALTQVLYDTHDVHMVWNIMGVIGIISAIGIAIYGKWVLTLVKK